MRRIVILSRMDWHMHWQSVDCPFIAGEFGGRIFVPPSTIEGATIDILPVILNIIRSILTANWTVFWGLLGRTKAANLRTGLRMLCRSSCASIIIDGTILAWYSSIISRGSGFQLVGFRGELVHRSTGRGLCISSSISFSSVYLKSSKLFNINLHWLIYCINLQA